MDFAIMENVDITAGGGDISQEELETVNIKLCNTEECEKEQPEDHLYLRFHNSYSHLTSITSNDNKDKTEVVDEVKSIIENISEKLNYSIKSITKEDKSYARLLGMKVFLQHIHSKFIEETEAVILLNSIYEEAKPHLASPEIAYSGFLIMNSLSTILQKSNSFEKIKDILEEGQSVYNSLKKNKQDNYYSGKELFSPNKTLVSNKEAKLKFEKLAITNLLFLGSIYEKLGDHYKDILCYHTAFERMLNKGLVSPYKWVDFTTRLACVFIDDNNFKDARHHLSAATHVHEILEGKNKLTLDNAIKETLSSNAIHLALAWVRYSVLLFEKSKDEDRTKFIILYTNGYLLPNGISHQGEKTNISEQYEDYILNKRNAEFKNQNFIQTIDKELIDSDYNKAQEYRNILREKNIQDIVHHIQEEESKVNKSTNDKVKCDSEPTKKTSTDECSVEDRQSEPSSTSKQTENCAVTIDSEKSSNQEVSLNETSQKPTTNCESSGKEVKNVLPVISKTEIETVKNDNCIKEEKTLNAGKKLEKENEGNETNLTFSSLGYLPIEHTVTKDLIQNPEEAKRLFKFAIDWSKQAQYFYPKSKDFYSYVHIMLNMVSLYRLCAYFQGRDNLDYRISLEQTREILLEQLVTELTEVQPESYVHVRLYQEMALLNIDLAMLNMCNIYNIRADDTYKLCALAEIQSHINHTYIVGDMLEKTTEIIDHERNLNENTAAKAEEEIPKDKIQIK